MGEDILKLQTDDIIARTRLLENETKILKSEIMRISHEHQSQKEKIKENKEKIKLNKTLPYLVSNVIEVKPKSHMLIKRTINKIIKKKIIRFWTLIHKVTKKKVPMSISIHNARENVPS